MAERVQTDLGQFGNDGDSASARHDGQHHSRGLRLVPEKNLTMQKFAVEQDKANIHLVHDNSVIQGIVADCPLTSPVPRTVPSKESTTSMSPLLAPLAPGERSCGSRSLRTILRTVWLLMTSQILPLDANMLG